MSRRKAQSMVSFEKATPRKVRMGFCFVAVSTRHYETKDETRNEDDAKEEKKKVDVASVMT